MATITAVRARPTVPGEIRWYPMAATQTFKKGEFLSIVSATGYVQACTADSPITTGCVGMAEADALDLAAGANGIGSTTTTGVACPVTIAKRGQQFTMMVTSNGTATTTALTDVGAHYSLFVGSSTTNSNYSHFHYVDKSDTSNGVFVVDAIAPDDTVGDTNGRLIVEVRSKYATLDAGTS
jgi:hypothetical protein